MKPAPSSAAEPGRPSEMKAGMVRATSTRPARSAWVEIDREQLRRNFAIIQQHKPATVQLLAVVKDNAYGHGAVAVAQTALEAGAVGLGVSTLAEARELRAAGLDAPILLLGERCPDELPECLVLDLIVSLGEMRLAHQLNRLALRRQRRVPVHLKMDTGMSRYGVRWDEAVAAMREVATLSGLKLAGVMSHFAMSDETDKTFARLQLARFQEVLDQLAAGGCEAGLRHLCNTGGFLDLPQAHYDLVRLGILPLGVYPSTVCRRLPGLEPVMAVKARIASVRELQPGDRYGYGLRFRAESPRRIAVLPVGYGDGFPRLRNQGHVLVHGRRAPIIGGVAMDALAVDITDIPEAHLWDDAVLLGRQEDEEITANDIAAWKGSVCYDVLAGWRSRLPRVDEPDPDPL